MSSTAFFLFSSKFSIIFKALSDSNLFKIFAIDSVERRIKTLEKGDLTSKIEVVGSDELSILTENFNKLILDVRNLLKQTEKLETEINIPNDVTVTLKSNTLQINGPVGRTYKNFKKIPVNIELIDLVNLLHF